MPAAGAVNLQKSKEYGGYTALETFAIPIRTGSNAEVVKVVLQGNN